MRTDGGGLARTWAAEGLAGEGEDFRVLAGDSAGSHPFADRADLAGAAFDRVRFEEAQSEEGSQPPIPDGGPAELATDLVPPRGLMPAQCGCQIASS